MAELRLGLSIPAFDAARTIFDREKICFSTAMGPNGFVMVIDSKQRKRVESVIREWQSAINQIDSSFSTIP